MALDALEEFIGVETGNALRNDRALLVAAAFADRPGMSLPKTLQDDSQLTLTYNFLASPHVSMDDLLAPHQAATVERAATGEGGILAVIHDGTEMSFSGSVRRAGLGVLPNGGQGFNAHLSLAVRVGPSEVVDPLGVIAANAIFRKPAKKKRRGGYEMARAEPGEDSAVWMKAVRETDDRLGTRAVHIMDRGADAYRRLCELLAEGKRFVIRNKYDRRVEGDGGAIESLTDALARETTVVLSRIVSLSSRHPGELATDERSLKKAKYKRTPTNKKAYPPRKEREAVLNVTARTVTLLRPKGELADLPKTLRVNIVHVFEPNPPEGMAAVEWILVTSEAINTAEEVAAVVDLYRARWTIEELNKALKSGGCEYEQLQLETRQSFLNSLAFCLPIGWLLLRMRALSRLTPDAPATTVLSEVELEVLGKVSSKPLPARPTVREATYALAAYGGHLKRNGEPGYLILGRALQELRRIVEGWVLAQAFQKPIQS